MQLNPSEVWVRYEDQGHGFTLWVSQLEVTDGRDEDCCATEESTWMETPKRNCIPISSGDSVAVLCPIHVLALPCLDDKSENTVFCGGLEFFPQNR